MTRRDIVGVVVLTLASEVVLFLMFGGLVLWKVCPQ